MEYRNIHKRSHEEGYEDSVESDLLVGTKRNIKKPSEHRNFYKKSGFQGTLPLAV
jgi:hypothetical protein